MNIYLEDLVGGDAVKVGTVEPSEFTISSDPTVDWDKYAFRLVFNDVIGGEVVWAEIKNEYDTITFASGSAAQKSVWSRWAVATQAERDSIDSVAVQEFNAKQIHRILTASADNTVKSNFVDNITTSEPDEVEVEVNATAISPVGECLRWSFNGRLDDYHSNLDGGKIMHRNGEIVFISVYLEKRGLNGDMIIDVNKYTPTQPITTQRNNTSGTTFYTTQANRPTLTGDTSNKDDNALIEAGLPDIVEFNKGDIIGIDIDDKGQNAEGLSVTVVIIYK